MENKITPTVAEVMQERGFFTVNGYTFTVEPVYYGEELAYYEDVPWNLYPRNKDKTLQEDISDNELALYGITLMKIGNAEEKVEMGLFERIKLWLVKHFIRDYRYYSDSPSVYQIAKWVEKKVKYKGKNIRFYDLERKYKLTKSEIVKLLGFFEDMSFFQ